MTPEEISKLINKRIFYNNIGQAIGALIGIQLFIQYKKYTNKLDAISDN